MTRTLDAWRQALLVPNEGVRRRLPRDVVTSLFGALIALAGFAIIAHTQPNPVNINTGTMISAILSAVAYGGLVAVGVACLTVIALGRRIELLVGLVVALTLSTALCWFIDHAIDSSYTYAPPAVAGALAIAVLAIRTMAAPLRARWWWSLIASIGALTVEHHLVALGVLAAGALGAAIAALYEVIVRTPDGTTPVATVGTLLDRLGVSHGDIVTQGSPTWGVSRYLTFEGTSSLLVDVYERDAAEGQFIARLWRFIWMRRSRLDLSLRRRDHAVLNTSALMLCEKVGVRAPQLVTMTLDEQADLVAVVARTPVARPFAQLAPDEVEPDVVADLFEQLARAHEHQLALGSIDVHSLALDEGRVVFVDLARANPLASTNDLAIDDAAAFVALAEVVGDERAASLIADVLDADRLHAMLTLLQPAALPDRGALNRARRKQLGHLRDVTTTTLGVEPVALTPLARVQPARMLMAVATLLGLWMVTQQLLGLGDLKSLFADANWWWALAVLAVTQATAATEALSMSGSVVEAIPLGPLTLLRFAMGFTGMIGGTVATTATLVRFFQRRGLEPVVALSSGVIYSVSGFVVQIVGGLGALVFAADEFSKPNTSGDVALLQSILWIVVVVGLALGVAASIPKVRRLALSRVRPHLEAAWQNARAIVRRPNGLARLFIGAALTQLMMAMGLGFALRAFGASASLAGLFIVCTLTALLGGMAPVPGGMGVMEASYIAGLSLLGINEAVAAAAVFMYRLATTYLPPVWGWGALVAMRRRGDL